MDDATRDFIIESMADAIWREGLDHLPLGASTRLARAAFDAVPEHMWRPLARAGEPD